MTKIVYCERSLWNRDKKVNYVTSSVGKIIQDEDQRSAQRITLSKFIYGAFLPEGYPASVSDDYLTYQVWDTVQAFASSIAGSLSTQAVLKGVGVGDETATALSATMTWLTRQGAGMISQILFTWTQGTDLDHNCKKWRLFADVMNDLATGLELTAPMWSSGLFQIILCLASVARSLVGVAGGATRAAIVQHQAKSNNISDVSAKDGSQETMVNLAALLVNLVILPLISEDPFIIWTLFIFLTILHLFANFKAVSNLKFHTMNKDRFLLAIQSYNLTGREAVDNPKTINRQESVFLGIHQDEKKLCGSRIHLGCSLKSVLDAGLPPDDLGPVVKSLKEETFFIFKSNDGDTYILLSDRCQEDLQLKAYFAAFQLNYCQSKDVSKHLEDFSNFREKLIRVGWDTKQFQVGTLGWAADVQES